MGQRTAKSVVEVLEWLEETSHHKAALVGEVLELRGHSRKLRIPTDIWTAASPYVRVGDEFDTRTYRANDKGRAFLRRKKAGAS